MARTGGIPAIWIPAIPAGMTGFDRIIYNGERGAGNDKTSISQVFILLRCVFAPLRLCVTFLFALFTMWTFSSVSSHEPQQELPHIPFEAHHDDQVCIRVQPRCVQTFVDLLLHCITRKQ
jgi:hypothetical protein